MSLTPFFKPAPSFTSRRGRKHHQLAALNSLPVCLHYLKGCIPVTLHYFWLHFLPLLKSARVEETLTALKKLISHIYHPLKDQIFQSTLSNELLVPQSFKSSPAEAGRGEPWPAKPMLPLSWCTLMLYSRDSTLQQKENCISIRMSFQTKGCV